MTEKKIAISVNDFFLEVLDDAASVWPELAGNRSALVRKVAADWTRIREENGGRSTRIERKLTIIVEMLDVLLEKTRDDQHDAD